MMNLLGFKDPTPELAPEAQVMVMNRNAKMFPVSSRRILTH
jgi:hypothetical protein